MTNVSFLINGDSLGIIQEHELQKIASTREGRKFNFVIYFNKISSFNKCTLEQTNIHTVYSRAKHVTSLTKALIACPIHWVVFCEYDYLIENYHSVGAFLAITGDAAMVIPNSRIKGGFNKLFGRRSIIEPPFIAVDAVLASKLMSSREDIPRIIKKLNHEMLVHYTKIKFGSSKKQLLARVTVWRPNIKILKNKINKKIKKIYKNYVLNPLNHLLLLVLVKIKPKIQYSNNIPIFIICRDRLSPLKKLIEWLEVEGMRNIILLDNASTYAPLLNYYSTTKYEVIRLRGNIGQTAPWSQGIIELYAPNQPFIVTDPDVIPLKESHGAIKHFINILNKYPRHVKVGFGLKIDDIPDHYELKSDVIGWESQFWKNEVGPDVYDADTDTTFALYRPSTPYVIKPSLRTGGRFMARHEPWYVNSKKITKELQYYRSHANTDVSTWGSTTGDLANFYIEYNNTPVE